MQDGSSTAQVTDDERARLMEKQHRPKAEGSGEQSVGISAAACHSHNMLGKRDRFLGIFLTNTALCQTEKACQLLFRVCSSTIFACRNVSAEVLSH